MNKTYVAIVVLVLVIFGGWYFISSNPENGAKVSDPLNTTYLIDGESFTLVDGLAEKEVVPGAATKNKVSVFSEPVLGDVDGDGDDDAVVILVNDPGGSGTFYYAVIAANVDGEHKGTDAILLGDRILPQAFYIEDNRAKVDYLDRAFDEPFSVDPSIKKSVHIQFDPETFQLIQVAVDFEGEADPGRLMLDMHPWSWIKTIYNNDTEVTPNDTDVFTLTFKDDGTFSATTDCNAMSGGYEVEDNKISFGSIAATLKFCEDSQEQKFSSMLGEVRSFLFTSRGELVLELKFDSGSMIFR